MGNLNKAIIMGRLGRDVEVRESTRGEAIANFTVATSETWRDKQGEKQEKTEWHRCVCFGPRAEVLAKYLQKGDPIYVEGRIETRKWTDKDDIERYTTEIVVSDFQFIHSNKDKDDDRPAKRGRDDDERPAKRTRDDERPAKRTARDDDAPRRRREEESMEKIKRMKDDLPWEQDDIPY